MASYLMLLNITTPVPEHAKIITVMSSISPDGKAVYFDKHGGAFLFNTDLPLAVVRARFEGVLLSGDRHIIVELGTAWCTYGYNVAAGWLRHHLGTAEAR